MLAALIEQGRRMGRTLPRPVWLLCAAYGLLALLYATVTPPFEKPDEPWHFAFAMYVAETGRLPVQHLGARDHLAEQEGSQPPLYYALLAGAMRAAGLRAVEPGYHALTQENPFYGGRPGAWHANANQFLHGPCTDECARAARAVALGRGLSILFGLAALLAGAVALRLAFPDAPWLAVAVLGTLAFNPQFLHITSAVSNDAATVAMVNVALALAIAWQRRPSPRLAAAIGAAAALATLSKASGLSVGLVAGLWLLLAPGVTLRQRAGHLAALGGTFVALTGWWFARNLALYGEPTATAIHLQVYGTAPAPLTPARLLTEWQAIANSFWASFGWGGLNLPDPAYSAARGLALALALLSLGLALRRWPVLPWPARALMALCAGQLLVVGALLARWNRLTVAPLGRLLFPAALPIGLLLALGAWGLLPPRWRGRLVSGYVATWALLALALALALLRPAYLPPAPLAALPVGATPLTVRFGDNVELVGIELPRGEVAPGTLVPITLFWRAQEPVAEHLAVGLTLHGRGPQALARANSFPAQGNAPTTTWQPGTLLRDEWRLLLPPTLPLPVLAPLEVALFRPSDGSFLPATIGGAAVGTVRPASLLVRGTEPHAVAAPAPFAVADARVAVQGTQAQLDFVWEVGAPLAAEPLQMLLHLTPGVGQPPAAAGDRPPQGGLYPTTLWRPGERLPESASLPLPSDLPPGDFVLLVGLYDPTTLRPLPGAGERTAWTVGRLRWDGSHWQPLAEAEP